MTSLVVVLVVLVGNVWCTANFIADTSCPVEPGFCVTSSGADQNSGVIKKNSINGNTKTAQQECLKLCHAHPGATGCEVIWNQSNRGCYVHTSEIARGNNQKRHFCWVFSKCIGNTMSDCFNPTKCASCYHYRYWRGFRTIDGTCNDLRRKTRGAAFTPLGRLIDAEYVDSDGHDTPRGFPNTPSFKTTPTAHEVSRALFKVQNTNSKNLKQLSVMYMTFGQFLDHDVGETPNNNGKCRFTECPNISSYKYPCFPIKFTRNTEKCTGFGRSKPVCQDPSKPKQPRQQINKVSSFIDLSQVYSNDFKRHQKMKKLDGSGELKVTKGNLMPIEYPASDTRCDNPAGCTLVGDDRGDENIALNAMHTLWVRNHNLLARKLRKLNPKWNEHRLFEMARKINIAVFQRIVYHEWLSPLVELKPYKYYKRDTDASLLNAFSGAAFRFGHSLIPNSWAMLDKNFDPVSAPIPIQNTFFNTEKIRQGGIEHVLNGLCANDSQEVDTTFSHAVARKLFVKPGHSTYRDLTALNIMRGRDHGLPRYGKWRDFCNMKKLNSFDDLQGIMPNGTINKLKQLYKHPDHIDLFAAGIAEKHHNNKIVGETFQCIIKNQFERLREGDRYYYDRHIIFSRKQRKEIQKMSLARVLCDNMKGMVSIQRSVFHAHSGRRVECSNIPNINLIAWKDHGYRRSKFGPRVIGK